VAGNEVSYAEYSVMTMADIRVALADDDVEPVAGLSRPRSLRVDLGIRRGFAWAWRPARSVAGSAMSGIALKPTAVAIEGDTATITYDVLVGGTVAYTGQTGTLAKLANVGVVPMAELCRFLASASNPCLA